MTSNNPEFRGLLILIPTRNRADMAIEAIRSVLGSTAGPVSILISDNSSDPHEANRLQAHCEQLPANVVYIRPPSSASMPEHWNWAIGQALERSAHSHLTILTDRFLFRESAVDELCRVLAAHPDKVVTFRSDDVFDHAQPSVVALSPWSDKVLRCRSRDIVATNSRSTAFELVPVPLHSALPRFTLERIRQNFGSYCLSLAPDFACGFRALALESDILIIDKALSLSWGRNRSSGFGFTLGRIDGDSRDFANWIGSDVFCPATPFPEISTCGNVVTHEYLLVRENKSNAVPFPELDMQKYVEMLQTEIACLKDGAMRSRFQSLLDKGPARPGTMKPWRPPWEAPAVFPDGDLAGRIRAALVSERTRKFWWTLAQLGVIEDLPWRLKTSFASPADARAYAMRFRGEYSKDAAHLPDWLADCAIDAGTGERVLPLAQVSAG